MSQLSTTLRYAHHEIGEAHEGFILFVDVSSDRSSDGLLKYVIDTVNIFGLKEKWNALNDLWRDGRYEWPCSGHKLK